MVVGRVVVRRVAVGRVAVRVTAVLGSPWSSGLVVVVVGGVVTGVVDGGATVVPGDPRPMWESPFPPLVGGDVTSVVAVGDTPDD